MSGVDSLLTLSLKALADSIDRRARDVTLACLPEELTVDLFQLVLKRGKLTPAVLQLFKHSPAAAQLIEAYRIREPPPLIASSETPWLGEQRRV